MMTYDFFGAWDAHGPTAPHSPLTSYSGIPTGRASPRPTRSPSSRRRACPRASCSRHRLLRPRLDRRHPGRPGRHGHGPGGGNVRAGHRGLQGAQDVLPGHRHRRRHGVRALRQQLVVATTPRRPSPGRWPGPRTRAWAARSSGSSAATPRRRAGERHQQRTV